MILGLIILALIVVGLFVAFAAFVMFWIVMAVFWISAVVLAFAVQDPHLGFFLAIPVTGLIFWVFGRFSEKPPAPENLR